MTGGRTSPVDPLRRRLVVDPADPEACSDAVRRYDGGAAFRWFRRGVCLGGEPEGDVLRKALDVARLLAPAALAAFAGSARADDAVIRPFAAAALLLSGRVDFARLGAAPLRLADARGPLERILALLTPATVPSSLREAFEIMIGKQEIGSLLLNAGYVAEANRMDLNTSAFILAMRRKLHPGGPRFLTEQWTFAIGHMVLLAFLAKGQDAGVFEYRGLRVWKGRTANWYLWAQTRRLSPDLQEVPRGAGFADNHYSRNFEWVDGRFVDYLEACGVVADRAGDPRGGILRPPEPAHPILSRYLRAAGIDAGEPVVTLHCREGGYRDDLRHDLRNVDIAGYLPALRALTERGYRVIRLGDATMTPLPEIPGVHDYAVSPLKSAELDILLPGFARFHIGSSSGLSLVPLLYGTPCLFLNWYPFDMLPWGRRNWTVLKPIESLLDGRRVLDRTGYETLGRMRRPQLLAAFGHQVSDLQPAEVERAVLDFADTVEVPGAEPEKTGRNIGRILTSDAHGRLADLV